MGAHDEYRSSLATIPAQAHSTPGSKHRGRPYQAFCAPPTDRTGPDRTGPKEPFHHRTAVRACPRASARTWSQSSNRAFAM
jgi:hypothetical protein